jgi:D-aminopeptidase
LPLTCTADGVLRVNLLSVIVFDVIPLRNEQGEVVAIEVIEQGRRFRCERIAEAAKTEQPLSAFAGNWVSQELGAKVAIGQGDAGSMFVSGLYGSARYKLEALCAGTCLLSSLDPAVPLNGTLRLVRSVARGRELVLDTARSRNLRLVADAAHG